MYSLDVNFLNDRAERQTEVVGGAAQRGGRDSPAPLYYGLVIGLLFPLLAGGAWLFLQNQNASLRARQQELDAQLATLQAALAEVQNVNAQVEQLNAENQALATVFDRIKPWSAILQDIRTRVPVGVQISSITQAQATPAAPAPPPAATSDPNAVAAAAPEPPPSQVEISGYARTFSDVNDFVLVLQQSPFLNGQQVRLVNAQLIDNPTRVEFSGVSDRQQAAVVELPKVVQYKIGATLTDLPASDLLQDMKGTLSLGLPARIDALRNQGVIKP